MCEYGRGGYMENIKLSLFGFYIWKKNIFNIDEFGLFFNLMPDKTYVLKGESCHGGIRSKQRLTVLVGANLDGTEKLPLLVIGKSK